MRSDELLTRLRQTAYIGDVAACPEYTDAKLLNEMNDRLLALMSDEIVKANAGYGLKRSDTTCVAGTARYLVPPRSIAGTLEKLELQLVGASTWSMLSRVDINEAQIVDLGLTSTGIPRYFSVQDGHVELYPTPSAGYPLRFTFYIRPSQLVTSQSSTLGGDGVVRGRITSIDNLAASRQVVVDVIPFDQLLGTPAAITSGSQLIDIVHPDGMFSCAMFDVAQTYSGTAITLGGSASTADVRVGDFVRVADQTDWPSNLPKEFHRMIADRAAMEVLRELALDEKVGALGPTVQADVERFRRTIRPQVKSAPKVIPVRPYFTR